MLPVAIDRRQALVVCPDALLIRQPPSASRQSSPTADEARSPVIRAASSIHSLPPHVSFVGRRFHVHSEQYHDVLDSRRVVAPDVAATGKISWFISCRQASDRHATLGAPAVALASVLHY